MRPALVHVATLLSFVSGIALAETPVHFNDAILKATVEERLGVTNPTPSDMLELVSLWAVSLGISDLTGVEYATNMTSLNLYDNQVSDVTALSGLTSMKYLRLHHNNISDISPLSGLVNLNVLELGNNPLSDVSALLGMTQLTRLGLYVPLSNEAFCTQLPAIIANNPQLATLQFLTNRNPPANVRASDGLYTDRVHVTWDTVCSGKGQTRYQIRRTSNSPASEWLSGWLTATSYDDTTAVPGVRYSYAVRAQTIDSSDNTGETAYSAGDVGWRPSAAEAALKASDPQPPDGTENVPLDTVLRWSVETQGDYRYQVYLGIDPCSLDMVTEVGVLQYQVAGLQLTTTYYWRVDTILSDGTIMRGDAWSFTTAASESLDLSGIHREALEYFQASGVDIGQFLTEDGALSAEGVEVLNGVIRDFLILGKGLDPNKVDRSIAAHVQRLRQMGLLYVDERSEVAYALP